MIHLDTSFLIRALQPRSQEDSILRKWLRTGVPLGMSAVAWTEFLCGPLESVQVELALRIVPSRIAFDDVDAKLAAELFNRSGRRRGALNDCMVAATAIRAEASVATANRADFARFEPSGLRLA